MDGPTDEERRKIVEEASQAAYAQFVRNFESRYQHGVNSHAPRAYTDLPQHTREWLEGQSADDLREISDARKLIDRMSPETREWLKGKNAKDLQAIDGAVEFFGPSRTTARILMWIGGTAVSVIGMSWAAAKAGWDLLWWIRGIK